MENNLQTLLDLGFEEADEWLAFDGTLKYSLVRYMGESNILFRAEGTAVLSKDVLID